METLSIAEREKDVAWEYDEEADVLYLSLGTPAKALGIDIGEGVVVRFDESKGKVVGLTLLNLRSRLLKGLEADSDWLGALKRTHGT